MVRAEGADPLPPPLPLLMVSLTVKHLLFFDAFPLSILKTASLKTFFFAMNIHFWGVNGAEYWVNVVIWD